jgi:predicted Zn finger-like uncharacterized protein
MLFTRCPECDTTFRVTDDTLKKASGQVRCGRCASVFNAYAELHDPSAKTFEPEPPPRADVEVAGDAPPSASADAPPAQAQADQAAPPPPEPASSTATPPSAHSPTDAAAPDPTAASIGASSVADIVKEADAAAEAGAAEPPGDDEALRSMQDTQAISATEVDRVLASDVALPLPQTEYAWQRPAEPAPRPARSRSLSLAAALALLALGAQTIHHFRSEIAGHATFGPWLTGAYAALGAEVTPSWDVGQYEILDWIASAGPNERGVGSLKITARIQNRGPKRQPYPAVQLRLKDRWEAAVGSRMFAPAEYLPRDTPRNRLMSPGETARAEIEVVDPGPDAYGFELDVCIEVEASLVTCGTDEVFL